MSNRLDTVLIKVASRCNLDCTYCYVYRGADQTWRDQPKQITSETIQHIADALAKVAQNQDEGFAIVLHGGEPLLLKIQRLEELFLKLRRNLRADRYPISIQTNGVLLSAKILDLCSKYRVSISVSIDGDKNSNDIARIDHRGQSSFTQTLNGIDLLKSHDDSEFLFAGTLTVIQANTDAKRTYDFLKSLGTPSIDFLFQDGNHDQLPSGKESFNSTEYGIWLSEILELYIKDENPAPIRILDDYIRIMLGGSASKEGKGDDSFGILVIETNGEIKKNDTLRASFNGADKFSDQPKIGSVDLLSILNNQEFEKYSKIQQPTSQKCKTCNYLSVCGGGMPLYRWSSEKQYNNPSIYCNDHKVLIDAIHGHLGEHGVR